LAPIITIYHDATSCECQIYFLLSQDAQPEDSFYNRIMLLMITYRYSCVWTELTFVVFTGILKHNRDALPNNYKYHFYVSKETFFSWS